MIDVLVRGELPLAALVSGWMNARQSRFRLSAAHDTYTLALHLNEAPHHGLFHVVDSGNVEVSKWQVPGLCLYSGLEAPHLLSLSAVLGLVQARALLLNEHLRSEDFIHPPRELCLFSTLSLKQSFADYLESPHICRGCREFYCCLGLEPEIQALQQVISSGEKLGMAKE